MALPFAVFADAYSKKVLADKPMAYWRFSDLKRPALVSAVGEIKGVLTGNLPTGPRPVFYPDFAKDNRALAPLPNVYVTAT